MSAHELAGKRLYKPYSCGMILLLKVSSASSATCDQWVLTEVHPPLNFNIFYTNYIPLTSFWQAGWEVVHAAMRLQHILCECTEHIVDGLMEDCFSYCNGMCNFLVTKTVFALVTAFGCIYIESLQLCSPTTVLYTITSFGSVYIAFYNELCRKL